ncbi:CDP-alcohol phosphatidyltransferase family protein [Ferrovibrio sp.]|uniref:CDP-alcohol phosphatidyltransferase family protein n=1 Tax=Ferrovibrio sp. TaxID=1917215 RepID=UPI0026054817|nr:CDP-alcohol phosphatidyltransferase family protein [Ferrovibrio sp.]
MFDPYLRPLIDPPLRRLAHRLRWHADAVTLGGFALGLAAALALALDQGLVALLLFLLNRLADGLDGALARINGPTDRGGLLDIVLDFAVYALLAFAFAWRDPPAAALPAAFLLAAFMATASSFLAYAIIAAKRGQDTEARGRKSFYHLGGLTEGTETILFFALCLALPGWFPLLAWMFGALCLLTALGRVASGWRDFA